MFKTVVFLALVANSVYGKVALSEIKLPELSNNLVNQETKSIPPIQIELPVFNDILQKIIPRKQGEPKNDIQDKCEDSTADNLVDGKISSHESIPCGVPPKVDNGTALILTPFIEKYRTEEARNASRVNSKLFLGIESYSGFLTVNKTYGSNIFFWYFPVENKPINETPWIIWLQGGPGASSMTGLFDEIGPFKLSSTGFLKRNPFTWLQNHSLLFIDNPVGTGFSFTQHSDGYVHDMATCGNHLYEALRQFLNIFPELRTAPLFVAGESYAGKYVPALAIEIDKNKYSPDFGVNLEGLMIGNGYIDPSMISNIPLSFANFGLLNNEQLNIVDPLLKSFQLAVATNDSVVAKTKWGRLVSVLLYLTHQKQAYNFLKDDLIVGEYASFLKSSEVKRALHVGDIKFSHVNVTVNYEMALDFLSSAKPMYEKLLEDYRVLAYCGQLDQMLPCKFASEHYRTWEWSGKSEFLKAMRYPYMYDKKVVGYHQTGGHFTEVVIRGAGHMVPLDNPEPTRSLVTRWTHNKLRHRFGFIKNSYIEEYIKNSTIIFF